MDILHRMKHLLESGEQSDVEFLVGKEEEKEEPQLFKAHKIVLAGWDVFAAQFRTNEANNLDNVPIRVIDITASAFKAMLHFLYTKDVSLINGENFLEVYSAAKKYLLPVLIGKCHELAPEILNPHNSIAIWREAKLREDKILIEHCLQFFDEKFLVLMKSDGMLSLSDAELGEMLTRDTFKVFSETYLFTLMNCWATKQCKNEGIGEPTGKDKRAKMGPLINAIRFPLISPTTFINYIVPMGILTAEEVAAMLIHYFQSANDRSKQFFPLPFSAQPRAILHGENNKLMDKNVAEREKASLEARVSKANECFRARGMPPV